MPSSLLPTLPARPTPARWTSFCGGHLQLSRPLTFFRPSSSTFFTSACRRVRAPPALFWRLYRGQALAPRLCPSSPDPCGTRYPLSIASLPLHEGLGFSSTGSARSTTPFPQPLPRSTASSSSHSSTCSGYPRLPLCPPTMSPRPNCSSGRPSGTSRLAGGVRPPLPPCGFATCTNTFSTTVLSPRPHSVAFSAPSALQPLLPHSPGTPCAGVAPLRSFPRVFPQTSSACGDDGAPIRPPVPTSKSTARPLPFRSTFSSSTPPVSSTASTPPTSGPAPLYSASDVLTPFRQLPQLFRLRPRAAQLVPAHHPGVDGYGATGTLSSYSGSHFYDGIPRLSPESSGLRLHSESPPQCPDSLEPSKWSRRLRKRHHPA